MKEKRYSISVLGNKQVIQEKNVDFYTTDNDAWLTFKVADTTLNPETATITLMNLNDKSVVSESVVVENKTIRYHMRPEIIEHAGKWQIQLIFDEGVNDYTSAILSLQVNGHLMDGKEPALNIINNWNTFMRQAEDFMITIDDQLHELPAYQTRIANLETRKADKTEVNELASQKADKSTLEQLEVSVSQQLAQTDFVSQVSNLIGGYEKMYYKRENSLGWMTVMLRNRDEHVSWSFRNNSHDDFIILGDCFYGDISYSYGLVERNNPTSYEGTWATTASPGYTTEVGAKMRGEITGERIVFRFASDSRGGIWEFVIDGDTDSPIQVSTFSDSTTVTYLESVIVDGLTNDKHTIVGTFKGGDPDNPPTATARGWVRNGATDTSATFAGYVEQLTNNRVQDLLVGFSNKEYAFRARKAGTSHTYQFIPMHGSIGTAFKKTEPRFIADGRLIDYANLPIHEFVECQNFKLVQSVYGRNPESGSENLVEINTNVSINKTGNVEIAGKMKPLVTIDVENGYGIMFPVRKGVTTRALSSKGNEYPTVLTDYSSTYMPDESDTTVSFAFVSDSNPDFITAIRYNDIMNTLRTSEEKTGTPFWIEHRDSTLQKLYFRVFNNRTLTTEDVFKFSGTFNCGKIPSVHNLL